MSHRQHFYHWRVLAKVIGFVLFGLGGLLLGYVLFPLVSLLSPDRRLAKMRCRRLVQLSFRFFIGLLSKAGVLTFHISGAEELDRRGNIVIANHPTLIDIVFLISMIPNATCIVKPSLFNNVCAESAAEVQARGCIPLATHSMCAFPGGDYGRSAVFN